MNSFQPSDDSFLMEKELIKKPVGEFLNELSNKVKRSSSVKRQYTLEEIQREYGFPPKGSSPLKTREFLIESSSLSPPKIQNESLRELQKRTILQPVKILPSSAQYFDFTAQSNSSATRLFVPTSANIFQDGKAIIQKQQEEVKVYSGTMNYNANRDEQGLNQSTSKNEIKSTINKEIQNQTELQNQSQTQNKADIPILDKIEMNVNEDLNDSAEEQVVVLSHVRTNNHLKSILKPLANSPIRQKSLFTEFPDRQMPQRSFSLTSDSKLTLASSIQQQPQPANETNRILKIQPIEQHNDSNTEKQTEMSKPRENLRAAVQQDPELQLQKSKPILMRSQSLNGLKKVHFSQVQEESKAVPNKDRPLVDSAIFTVLAEVQEQKKQQYQQNQAQLVPQPQQLVHPPLANQNLRLSVPNLGTQGIQNPNNLTKQNEFVKFYSAFKQNLVRSRESSPSSSVSPLPRRPNQNMASSTLSPVYTKRCKTSPSTSPVLLSLSPLKADKAPFQTKDFSFRTVLNLQPAGAQVPQHDQRIGNESAVNLDTQQNSNLDLNTSNTQNKVLNESPFLKQISQNSSHKQDMKLKYKYDNSNYITHGQYYTPCYNIAPYQSHIKKNKDSYRLQSNSELGETESTRNREQLGSNNSRNKLLIQVNKVRIITNPREYVDNSLQEEQKIEDFERDSREREKQQQEQEIEEGEDKEEEDDSEEINRDDGEDDIQNKQGDRNQTKLEKDEKIETEKSPLGGKETEGGGNNEKKSPPPASSQSPLLELFKDQVISKRARVYFKRQDTNPVDSEEVTAARAVADRVIRSNSMK